MLCALIMAGGKGERFWPLSTNEKPKQFLRLLGEDTMIQMTVKRLQCFLPLSRIFVVTDQRYKPFIQEQIPKLPERNIIVEPIGKNTAPCIALSAFNINKYFKNATLVVVPSDHLIEDEFKFMKVIMAADRFVKETEESIVTLGMIPDRPESGYGYINYGNIQTSFDGFDIFRANKFYEKPSMDHVKKYLKAGNYLWNGGIFIWKIATILKLTQKYLKDTYEILEEIISASKEDYEEILYRKYKDIESISVDYGIMENADNIYVIPCSIGWDDIGTWNSIERYRDKDDNKNLFIGDIKGLDCSNNIIIGNNKQIVAIGLEDIFVVESENMLFIGKKEHMERTKEIKVRVG